MWAGIGVALQIVLMLLKWWFSLDTEKKAKVEAISKEIPNAKTASDFSRLFDDINRL